MLVLQLCNRVPFPLIDGGAIAMFAMTKSLAEEGCEVHTLAINTKKHFVDVNQIPDWFSAKTKLFTVDADTDVKASGAFLNLFSTSSYNLVRFDIPEFHEKLKSLLAQNKYDVIQVEGLFLCMYIPTIRKYSNAFVSMRAHNVEFLIWERMAQSIQNPFKKWYIKLLAKRLKREEIAALNTVDAIIPISNVDEQTYRDLGAKIPMLVCTGGVDEHLLSFSSNPAKESSLFHLAAMNWQPNIQALDWFLKSIWPLVQSKHPHLKLYLAGKDMPTEFLQQANEQVHVQGRVDNAQEFMLNKQIMLVPLLSGSGMRIKIVEGMALGKVIISTSIGAEGIEYSHRKNILIADNATDFAAAIELTLSDKKLCDEISANAKQLVKDKYTNASIIRKLLFFYQQNFKK